MMLYQFLLYGKVNQPCIYICVFVTQSCLTPWDPMGCSPPGSSVLGILQARILEQIAVPFSNMYIYHHSFGLTSHSGHHSTLSKFPGLIVYSLQLSLLYMASINICVNPNLPILPTLLFPLGIHIFVLYICVSISASQIRSSIPFFLFQIPYMYQFGICVFLFLIYFILYLLSLHYFLIFILYFMFFILCILCNLF